MRGESVFTSLRGREDFLIAERLAADEPTPDVIASIDEEIRVHLGMLKGDLREVARLKPEGSSVA